MREGGLRSRLEFPTPRRRRVSRRVGTSSRSERSPPPRRSARRQSEGTPSASSRAPSRFRQLLRQCAASLRAFASPGAVDEMGRGMAPLPPSPSLLPAWAGGALRWLNGGDFVLIPPPAASMPLGADAKERRCRKKLSHSRRKRRKTQNTKRRSQEQMRWRSARARFEWHAKCQQLSR